MELQFMGTGAADWDISTRREGEFFRRLTSVRINDDLIIDFNGETPDFLEASGGSVGGVRDILITHTHSDHYSNAAVNRYFGPGTTLWADEKALPHLGTTISLQRAMPLYTPVQVGRYTVLAVEANHLVEDSDEQPLHYVISDGSRRIFWGCDGAWLRTRAWRAIREFSYDLVVFDGTLSDKEGDFRIFEHNDLNMIAGMTAAFREQGMLAPGGKVMISHMSRYSQREHQDLAAYLEPLGILPAYDGLRVEI